MKKGRLMPPLGLWFEFWEDVEWRSNDVIHRERLREFGIGKEPHNIVALITDIILSCSDPIIVTGKRLAAANKLCFSCKIDGIAVIPSPFAVEDHTDGDEDGKEKDRQWDDERPVRLGSQRVVI